MMSKHQCMLPWAAARQRVSGFTLLEIMVAMIILSLIVTTAFGALRLGERSWEAGIARSDETENMRTLAALLQRQISQLLPLTWTVDTRKKLAFSGTHDRMRFMAPAPLHRGATGLFEFTLAASRQGNATRLVLDYRLHDPGMDGFQPEESDRQQVLLVDEIETAAIAYYGSRKTGDPPRWHTDWSSDDEAYPQLVRVRLTSGPAQPPWPELLLRLQARQAQ
jgi:general secretion pathway protein J